MISFSFRYIGDKNHIHMNATCWSSLTGLCKYLGKEGKCVVDETEKGWFIQYIDRDPKLLAKQAMMEQRQAAELDDEERVRLAIEAQIKASKELASDDVEQGATELVKDAATPVSISLGGSLAGKKKLVVFEDDDVAGEMSEPPVKRAAIASVFDVGDEQDERPIAKARGDTASSSSHGSSALEAIRMEEERRKNNIIAQEEAKNRKDYWLHPGIQVKIVNKTLSDGRFYKQKGVVVRVLDEYVGEVRVQDTQTLIRLDQADLETVIPKVEFVQFITRLCQCIIHVSEY